jgi:competence protein ComEC
MYFADIMVESHDGGWPNQIRRRFQAGLYNALPDRQASFVFGLLIGARSSLPADFNDKLAAAGLMHLVAVSGYNLTIIVQACRRLMSRFSPRVTVFASLLLIAGFLLITGFSASSVRASIVSALSLAAWLYGREPRPVSLLLLSAAISVLMSPLYVWGDLGWYLSFLAFFGVIVLAPLVEKRFIRTPRFWQSVLIETMSAIVLTSPLIMFSFGRVSLIAPVANLLVLPFVPVVMLLGAVVGLFGALTPVHVGVIAAPLKLLLGWIMRIITSLGGVSWSQQSVSLTKAGLVVWYGLIFLVYVILHRRSSRNVVH